MRIIPARMVFRMFLLRFRRQIVFWLMFGLMTFILMLLVNNRKMDNDIPTNYQKDMHRLDKRNQQSYIDHRGIHVVVGHYQKDLFEAEARINLTDDLINKNMYRPIPGLGEDGRTVHMSPQDRQLSEALYSINRFNLLVSDRISVNRSLPDIRKAECLKVFYELRSLPTTSIIIVFHNEAWSTLLRTIHSVINRSPLQLIREIILVDDASQREFLGDPLEEYISLLPVKISLLRSHSRIGLIRARIMGFKRATGQVVTFLDAHCECTKGWLEPLLHRIYQNRKVIVCPVIDVINDDTFAYARSFDFHWGAINWSLHFRWFAAGTDVVRLRKTNVTQPFKTPIMAGGLFAVDREYFAELGLYDEEMDIWGGENVELSFRAWQCGGRVEISPCSHVGHIFRKSSPYKFPNGVTHTLYRNLVRVVLVWMDEWKEFFFRVNPEVGKFRGMEDVSSRVSLVKKLNCKPFSWFLSNIWPENFFPRQGQFFGRIRNRLLQKCVQRPSSNSRPSGNAELRNCVASTFPSQLMVQSAEGRFMSDESICLDAPNLDMSEPPVMFLACGSQRSQLWTVDEQEMRVVHKLSKLCLDVTAAKTNLFLNDCKSSESQQWNFVDFKWK